ncbi:MAG: glycine cleavage system aminomethyltransferase GcvT [Bdellovibrionales bacterium]|nr:glycine cleavage system aminomethyltransferase GcvT [Bdellovibrionales bacterium]
MSSVRTTPLVEEHIKLNAKMVDFAGWLMPVEYQGLRYEHLRTRSHVGLFDVSHMGEIRITGPKSLTSLQWLTTNDVSRLGSGQAQYSLFTNREGGIVDDIIVYCIDPQKDYLVCVNAANVEKDFAWIQTHNQGAEISNESDQWGQIAVQGPNALGLVSRVFSSVVTSLKPFQFKTLPFAHTQVLVARTGYTGEDGVEIFVPQTSTASLWQTLLSQGELFGVTPVGLGARDTLRTEMKYSLYGHEIDDSTHPYEAGLGWVVKPEAKDFLGKKTILEKKSAGLNRRLVGFKAQAKGGIPRTGYSLFSFDNREIGRVTSGTLSPSLNESIGIGYVDTAWSEEGSQFDVEIRGRRLPVNVVKTPFVSIKRS